MSGLNKNGPFVETASATPNGYKDIDTILNSPTIYNVTNFGPYIKVQFSTPNCPNGLNLSATLIPFPSNVTVQGDTSNASFPVQIGGKFVTSGGITALSASPSGGDLYVRPRAVGASGFLPTSPVSISSASATTVFSGDSANDVTIVLQNQGTFPVRCGTEPTVNSTTYSFSLRAASVAGDGSGGTQQLVLYQQLPIKCIAIGGTGTVSYLIY